MSDSSQSGKQKWLQRIQRRLQFGLFLKSFVDWTIVFCMALGCFFLATKLFWTGLWPYAMWLLLAGIPIVLAAWWYSRRDSFRNEQSVALLDRRIGAGGLLMTVVETPDHQWESRLPAARQVWQKAIPAIRPVRAMKLLILPMLFLLVTCLIPPRTVQSLGLSPSTVSRTEVSRLNDMLKELDESEVLKEEERDEIAEQIKKLARETKYTPLTHENWETVDALRQKMELKLANRQNQLQQVASAMAALQQAIRDSSQSVDADKRRLENLLQDLAEAAPKVNQSSNNQENENQSGDPGDLSRFQNSDGSINLPTDADSLQAALDELGEFIEGQCQNVGKLRGQFMPCDCDGCEEGGT